MVYRISSGLYYNLTTRFIHIICIILFYQLSFGQELVEYSSFKTINFPIRHPSLLLHILCSIEDKRQLHDGSGATKIKGLLKQIALQLQAVSGRYQHPFSIESKNRFLLCTLLFYKATSIPNIMLILF